MSDHDIVHRLRTAKMHFDGFGENADALCQEAAQVIADYRSALTEIARVRTELAGDFSLSSKQSDIARTALPKDPTQ